MKNTSVKLAVAMMMMAVVSSGSAAAQPDRVVTIRTRPVVPDPEGSLDCKVVVTSATPIGIVAAIVDADGNDVTDYGASLRLSPIATGDDTFHAEETAGSFADGARSCRITVTGARRKDIEVSLTAFDCNGNPLAVER